MPPGVVKDAEHVAGLYHGALAQDHHLVRQLRHHAKIVGHHQDGDPQLMVDGPKFRIISFCTLTSRAVVGSSARIRDGAVDGAGDHQPLEHPAGELKGYFFNRTSGGPAAAAHHLPMPRSNAFRSTFRFPLAIWYSCFPTGWRVKKGDGVW